MADIGYQYNAEDHKPLEDRDPVPPDKYEAQIVESSVDPTKAGNGRLMKLVWQITSGEYEGRKVFDRVNLENPNPKAVEIGQRQLSSICRAVGKLRIEDTSELHDTTILIDVRVKPAEGQYAASNEIRGYFALDGTEQATAPAQAVAPAPVRQAPAAQRTAPAPARQPVAAGTGGGKPPWVRK